jgi:hypothetical protein
LSPAARRSWDPRRVEHVLSDEEAATSWICPADQGGQPPESDSRFRRLSAADKVAYGHLLAATGMGHTKLGDAVRRLRRQLDT